MSSDLTRIGGGLATRLDKIAERRTSPPATKPVVLLLDVSGSMGETVRGDSRKIDELRRAVAQFPHAVQIAFAAHTTICAGELPEPHGGTFLAPALRQAGHLRPSRIVIVSDGLAGDMLHCPEAAKPIRCPVDAIYIGDGDDEGERFLRWLTETCGGSQTTVAAADASANRLTDCIRGFLGGPTQ